MRHRWTRLGTALTVCVLLAAGLAVSDSSTSIVANYPLNYSGAADVNHGGTATMAIWFDDAVAGTYTTEVGSYSLTVNGAPTNQIDYTLPSGLGNTEGESWWFDGTNDWLSRADDGTFEPAGDFSVQCVITPYDVAGAEYLIGKYESESNRRSWMLWINADDVYFDLSDDGAAGSSLAKTTSIAAYRPAFVTASYDYVSAGSSVASIYIDNLSTATDSSFEGPAYDGTASFGIGSADFDHATGAANEFYGEIHFCRFLDGTVLTEAQHDAGFAQWQGRASTYQGNYVSVSSAAPPAIVATDPASGVQPFILDNPANSLNIGEVSDGSGGLMGAAAIQNDIERSSIETYATGWTLTGNHGDGSYAWAQENTHVAHGGVSAKITLTGTTSYGYATPGCMTAAIGNDAYLSYWAKELSGTSNMIVQIEEYDAGDCTSYLGAIVIVNNVRASTTWTKYGGAVGSGDWDASTSSYKMLFYSYQSASAMVWDAFQFRDGASNPVDAYCFADTDASAACNHVIPELTPNPNTAGTWHVKMNARIPYACSDASSDYLMRIRGTSGTENRTNFYLHADTVAADVYDSAGAAKSTSVAGACNADTDFEVGLWRTDAGVTAACYEGTCDASPATGAIQITPATIVELASDSASGYDIWVNDLQFLRRYRP
jgi:hypothetical protein